MRLSKIILLLGILGVIVLQLQTGIASGSISVEDADAVQNFTLNTASSDALDSTDASEQGTFINVYVNDADAMQDFDLSGASADALDSTDATEQETFIDVYVNDADAMRDFNLEPLEPITPENSPPNPPTNLAQFKSDIATEIPVGGTTDERTVIFKATVGDPDGDKVKLQVELRRLDEYGGEFDETKGGFKESGFVESGSEALAYAGGLIDADYHWRARAVDEHGKASEWQDFGNNNLFDTDFTVAGITYAYDPQAAVDYAEKHWKNYNSTDPKSCDYYQNYSGRGGDCANFVSQCLIAGGLDLAEYPNLDTCGSIINCTNLHDFLVNYLGVTWDTKYEGQEEPEWFKPGDPAIFGKSDEHPRTHAVIAVTGYTTPATCNAHSDNKHHLSIQQFYDTYSNLDRCTFYHIISPAKPVLTSPLKITPEKDTYYVGDTLTAEFTITNIGDVPITLDKLLVSGRFNGGKLPNGEFPDFSFQSVTLQPNVPHHYTGTLELTQPGIYQFFIAYYIENPTPEEKALLDENNWNTCVDLREGLIDEDRTEDISTTPGYAIIVAGQGIGKCGIDHAANNAYRTLRNLGFDDDHIIYLNNESQQIDEQNVVDNYASYSYFNENLKDVKDKIGDNPTPFILYLVGHGDKDDGFVFDSGVLSREGNLKVLQLQEELDKFSCETPMLIIIGSCYSGCFITSNEGISAPNRIIITAAHDDQKRYLAGWGWFRASDQFWGDLNKGLNVKEAFVRRTWPADKRYLWLDDNGDSIGHPPHNLRDEGELAAATKIGIPGTENLKLTPWTLVVLRSPGELRVYDSQNRVTGLVNGEVKEEIPNSIYDEESETVAIFSSSDTYRHEIVGTDEGTYGLDIASIEDGNATTFTATEIPTSPNATHEYTVNWTILSQGGVGVTLEIDADGDGEFEETITIQPPIANFTYKPEKPVINQTIIFDASNSTDLDGNITSYKWDFADGTNGTGEIITHSYSSAGNYIVTLTVRDDDGATTSTSKTIIIYSPIFDTDSPANPYPSIRGTHKGTITPSHVITVTKMYTYPCFKTGGHSEFVALYNSATGDEIANGTWIGTYLGNYQWIEFNEPFTLKVGVTYNYTIITGSYPQIHHTDALQTANGWINCTKFTDANGKIYYDWIPAIRLCS